MATREFSKDELLDLDPEEIHSEQWRHGRRATYVATRDDGTFWRFTLDVHHEDGWQVYGSVVATQVHQVEKVVKVWEPVP